MTKFQKLMLGNMVAMAFTVLAMGTDNPISNIPNMIFLISYIAYSLSAMLEKDKP